MQITVWTDFVKKKNSMKKPNTSGTVVTCTLKGECSSVNPRFELGAASFGLVNYVKWESMYYFVRNVTFGINNYVILECEIDVLATWKEEILSNTAFVSYSSSNYNTNILDRRIAMATTTTTNIERASSPFGAVFDAVLLTTISKAYGIATFAMTIDNYRSLMQELLSDISIIQDIKEMFGAVNEGFVSCIQVPLNRTAFPDSDRKTVWIGSYESSVEAYMTEGFYTNVTTISIPWIYDDFRRCSEYTSVELVLPYIGTVHLPIDSIYNETELKIVITCNCPIGSLIYSIYGSDNRLIGSYTATFGINKPVATGQIDVQGVLRGAGQAVTGVSGIATGQILGRQEKSIGGASAMIEGIASTALSLATSGFKCFGGMGGNYGDMAIPAYFVIVVAKDTITNPSSITATNGRPCFKELALNTLSGYVETIGFSFETNAVAEVRDKINEFMDTGVYIE